jgi:hypothetical protein
MVPIIHIFSVLLYGDFVAGSEVASRNLASSAPRPTYPASSIERVLEASIGFRAAGMLS